MTVTGLQNGGKRYEFSTLISIFAYVGEWVLNSSLIVDLASVHESDGYFDAEPAEPTAHIVLNNKKTFYLGRVH